MDKVERAQIKQLANDAIIAEFGNTGLAAQLAEALEKCIDQLEYMADQCRWCKICKTHGDHYDDD